MNYCSFAASALNPSFHCIWRHWSYCCCLCWPENDPFLLELFGSGLNGLECVISRIGNTADWRETLCELHSCTPQETRETHGEWGVKERSRGRRMKMGWREGERMRWMWVNSIDSECSKFTINHKRRWIKTIRSWAQVQWFPSFELQPELAPAARSTASVLDEERHAYRYATIQFQSCRWALVIWYIGVCDIV